MFVLWASGIIMLTILGLLICIVHNVINVKLTPTEILIWSLFTLIVAFAFLYTWHTVPPSKDKIKLFGKIIKGSTMYYSGDIIKMDVASRSHVTEPYYVFCEEYNPHAKEGEVKMVTSIPGRYKIKMYVGSNWEYHSPRMTKIGTIFSHGYLLENQKLD